MTRLIIDNVKEEYIPAFKGLAEGTNATFIAESSEICDYGYSHIPNDETIRALEECERGEGEIVEDFSAIEFHKQMLAELESENGA